MVAGGSAILQTVVLGRCTWVLVVGLGCASTNKYEYAGAAVGLAANVAAAAINHAATGECYATCGEGTYCNRSTGLCERGYEAPPKPPVAPVTLEEKCTMVRRDYYEASASRGEKHPGMVTLRRMLDRCTELLRDANDVNRRCGPIDVELVGLEADGLGAQHPDVIAQRAQLASCQAEATSGAP